MQQWHGVERGNFNPVDILCVFGIPVTTPNDLFGDNFGGIQSEEIANQETLLFASCPTHG